MQQIKSNQHDREIGRIDLKNNKKMAIVLRIAEILILILLFFVGKWLVPFSSFCWVSLDIGQLLSFILVLACYLFGQAWLSRRILQTFSGEKGKTSWKRIISYPKTDAYFTKREYMIFKLAPILLFSVLVLVLNVVLPQSWFWSIYIFQIINLSIGTADFYIASKLAAMPAEVLIRNEDSATVIYQTHAD